MVRCHVISLNQLGTIVRVRCGGVTEGAFTQGTPLNFPVYFAAMVSYQSMLILLGGYDNETPLNVVFTSTDGKIWNQVSHADWSPRYSVAACEAAVSLSTSCLRRSGVVSARMSCNREWLS
jgi:hypothetical protein